ncbi:Transmembrane protease, serine 13 [Actinoplanes sp. SE50]|uniref:hypothetical protein n=1 Tax=unclassified Actinoplanes TaxID=2626549 RepID=UPI00023EBDB1|nr:MULTISPECIES: hypothetical protein [unclassified Actinoplanes]AEV86277.1 Transmembrane protease, serine 13 [Actinoplanes sp. SE50/110]ATO84674.1 Transmembrane protease, serine 13 [Actinoplanes sp. SE50]SLM02084.1 Transmembrane protease, serine 13 [Actinoplanes sp. SE50/110]
MRTKIVLFAGAAAVALLAGGCGDKATPAAAPGAGAVASAASGVAAAPGGASAAPADAANSAPGVTPTKNTPVSTSQPKPGTTKDGQPGPAPAGDPGDGGNWFAALTPCPNKGQQHEVQKLVFADVTGDGVKDALVASTCQTTNAYWPSTVEVFDGTTGKKPKRLGVLLKDVGPTDEPWYVSSSVSGKVVTVKAYGLSAQAPRACPDLNLTYTYKYGNGTFTRTGRQAAKASGCLPIQ